MHRRPLILTMHVGAPHPAELVTSNLLATKKMSVVEKETTILPFVAWLLQELHEGNGWYPA